MQIRGMHKGTSVASAELACSVYVCAWHRVAIGSTAC